MRDQVESYAAAAHKGAEWLLAQQNEDGSFVSEKLQADVYHKAVLALNQTGHAVAANRLLSWIKESDLQPDGRLRHFDEGLGLYKSSWVCQGAHRNGRFDISLPAMAFMLRCQAPCGGFFQSPEAGEFVEPVCTSWGGLAALYMGYTDAAQRAAECIERMVAGQPDGARFYSHVTPYGDVMAGEHDPFLDATQPGQAYYNPGIAMLFLARLYTATGVESSGQTAWELFEFSLRCAADAYAYPTAGKSAVAAALLYQITQDERALVAASSMGDYLVRQQSDEGWWRNPHSDSMIVRLDHTAEFVVFLTDIAATLGAAVPPPER
jgi:hypothetical protein